jgi:hypothetical protein
MILLALMFGITLVNGSLPGEPDSGGQNTTDSQQAEPISLIFDSTGSGAYVGRDYLSAYLVADSCVFVVTIALPEHCTDTLTVDISTSDAGSVTYYHGRGIEMIVRPSGPSIPFPPDYNYTTGRASGGMITCLGVPVRKGFRYGALITLSLDHIDFGDGYVCSSDPMEVTTGAFPP